MITFDPSLFNPAYIPLLYENTPFLHLFGSAGSGKSVFAAQKEIVYSYLRTNRNTLVLRQVASTLKNSIYAELIAAYTDMGLEADFDPLKSPLQITNKTTGVQFIFAGLDDVEKLKSIRNIDRILIEEATELESPEILDQLRLRVRGFKQKQITLCYNPINKFHWLNTEIHEKLPEKHRIFKSTYRDNLKLLEKDPEYGEYIESLKFSNPNYYKVYGLGEWGQNVEGLIWPDYQVVKAMPIPQFYGLDIGYTDPCALVEGAIEDAPNQTKKNLYLHERLYMSHLNDNELIEQLKARGINKDLPMYCDNAAPATIKSLQRAGYYAIGAPKGRDSVVASIKQVLEYDIKILAGSKELLKEISNWSWQQNKDKKWIDEPQPGADHLMSATRYMVRGATVPARQRVKTFAQQREELLPTHLRYDAIELRMPFTEPETVERELQTREGLLAVADMLRRKGEDQEEQRGHFSL